MFARTSDKRLEFVGIGRVPSRPALSIKAPLARNLKLAFVRASGSCLEKSHWAHRHALTSQMHVLAGIRA